MPESDVHKERGGATVGFFRATWPFATLELRDQSLTLKAVGAQTVELAYSDIDSISLRRPLFGVFGSAVRFHHHDRRMPTDVEFASASLSHLLNALRQRGMTPAPPPPATGVRRVRGWLGALVVIVWLTVVALTFAGQTHLPLIVFSLLLFAQAAACFAWAILWRLGKVSGRQFGIASPLSLVAAGVGSLFAAAWLVSAALRGSPDIRLWIGAALCGAAALLFEARSRWRPSR